MGLFNIGFNIGFNQRFGGIAAPPPTPNFDFFTRDVGSLTLQEKVAGNDAEVIGGVYAVIATTASLVFTDLTGITIVNSEGTSTPSISGNDINFTAGYISYLELSDGTKLYFNGHLYDSNLGTTVTGSGFDFQNTTSVNLKSTQDALDLGYYQNKDWLQCTASGTAYQESTQAYGIWEWDIKAGVSFGVNILVDSAMTRGLVVTRSADELRIINLNPISFKFRSTTNYLTEVDSYKLKAERLVNGSLSLYCDKGSGYELVPAVSGSNPFIDNTITTSDRFVVSAVTGDKIRNIQLTSSDIIPVTTELKVEDFTEGTGTYTIDSGEQVINKAFNTTGLPGTTGWTAHEGKAMLNFIDSYVDLNPTNSADPIFAIFDKSNTTIFSQSVRDSDFYDSSNPFLWFAGNSAENELTYDKMNSFLNPAYKDRNFAALLTNYGTQLSMFRLFSYANPKVGDDLFTALDYCNYWYSGHEALTDDSGNLLTDEDGNLLIEGN